MRVIVLAGASLAAGCANFQAHKLPIVQDHEFRVANAGKVKIFSRWKVESSSVLTNKDAAAAIYKSAFEKEIRESGCCEIVEGPTEANLIVDGTAIDHADASVMLPAFITGFSLYTIPSWVTQEMDIKVKTSAGNKNSSYELNDSFTLVQWLPMMFAFPFTGGQEKNRQELHANTFRSLIVKLKKDAYI